MKTPHQMGEGVSQIREVKNEKCEDVWAVS